MNLLKRGLALCLTMLLCLSLAACGGETPPEPAPEEPVVIRVGALKGPTGMGLAFLEEMGDEQVSYDLTIAARPDQLTTALAKGELDAVCIPANLAAVLYNRTQGGVATLGINTLGVLYIVENGNAVNSIADLAGKTIAASGKNGVPEYALRYLLEENGLDPDGDVIIDWKSEHSECVSALATGAATVALLPQPFVTVAQSRLPELREALDLTEEWAALDNGSALITGVTAADGEFIEAHPQAVETFLEDYAASVEKVNGDPAAAAARIGELEIFEAPVAEKALPRCNIVCLTGREMAEKLSGYLQVLFEADPEAVGGAMPGEEFYFGA